MSEPIVNPGIPTLTLGDYLYSQNYRNTAARYRDNTIKKRPFNPSIVLPSIYVIDTNGRTANNPLYTIAFQARYGFYQDEVSGGLNGERLAAGGIGQVDTGVLKFCQDRGIPLSPVIATGVDALQGNLSAFEVARLDALYVARNFETAWDSLIAPASTGTGTSTPTPTTPSNPTPTPGGSGSSSGLDPTSAVIADLRQQLATKTQLAESLAKRHTDLLGRLKAVLNKREMKPPVRGGGAPTASWRNLYNVLVTLYRQETGEME